MFRYRYIRETFTSVFVYYLTSFDSASLQYVQHALSNLPLIKTLCALCDPKITFVFHSTKIYCFASTDGIFSVANFERGLLKYLFCSAEEKKGEAAVYNSFLIILILNYILLIFMLGFQDYISMKTGAVRLPLSTRPVKIRSPMLQCNEAF